MDAEIPPRCRSLFGHKFEPRYSLSAAPKAVLDGLDGNTVYAVKAIMDRSRSETYEGDVCVRCGVMVHRKGA